MRIPTSRNAPRIALPGAGCFLAALVLGAPPNAAADAAADSSAEPSPPSPYNLQEIVVTARRREEKAYGCTNNQPSRCADELSNGCRIKVRTSGRVE